MMMSSIPEELFTVTLTPHLPSSNRHSEQELAVKMVADIVNNARLQFHLTIENPKEKVFDFLRF